jgi:hypothetical protein
MALHVIKIYNSSPNGLPIANDIHKIKKKKGLVIKYECSSPLMQKPTIESHPESDQSILNLHNQFI